MQLWVRITSKLPYMYACGVWIYVDRSLVYRHTFCLVHSNAHPGRTCREFELEEREKHNANKTAIAEFCKPCPRCKTMTEKNNGCVSDPAELMFAVALF